VTTRIALYARTSTRQQDPEIQLHALRAYAQNRGVVPIEFVEQTSGRKDSRPALNEMIRAARRREIGAVVITKLDRLARWIRHLSTLVLELESLDVDLVVLDQAIDTATPAGRLLLNVLGSIAEFEAGLIRERVIAGIENARRKGVQIGRPGKLDAEAVLRARQLRACGLSLRQVGRAVGASASTVHRALSAPEDLLIVGPNTDQAQISPSVVTTVILDVIEVGEIVGRDLQVAAERGRRRVELRQRRSGHDGSGVETLDVVESVRTVVCLANEGDLLS
jgi:DNA invertase Pin-like site-specific DNA recombinase